MSHKRAVALSGEIMEIKEPLNAEEIELETLEEYKSLNEKCDKVIIKIKSRKASKKGKK